MNKVLLFVLAVVFCVTTNAQVSNDDCVNATQITLDANGDACVTGTTTNALGVIYTAHPCWPTGQDIPEVWYTFVTSGTDNTITVTPTGGTPAQQVGVTVMSTNCAAPINNCDLSPTNGGTATTNWTYGVGTQVWINVGSIVGQGGFQLCISSNTPPPNPSGSCATATTLCNKNSFTVASFPNNSNGLQPSCFPTTFQRPVFYQFTVGTSGTCGWEADPNGNAEFDWVMYDITGGCPNDASPTFNCNFNFDSENGSPVGMQAGAPNNCPNDGSTTSGAANEFCPLQNVVAGNTYLIIIDNWTDDNTGFDFSWGGTFTIAPNPQFTMSSNTSCSPPLDVTFTNTSTTTVSQVWNFGNGNTSALAAPPVQTYTASGTYIVSLTGTSATGCQEVYTQNITIGEPPTVTVPTNTTVCAGTTIPAAVFTSTPSGATYTWTNTNTAIGLAASGSANIPAFTATNTTGVAITGVISVTPTFNGCPGVASSYTITVDPTPSIPAVTSQTVCNNVNTTTITFNPTPATATVNWTNSNGTIGVGTSGVGDIGAFTGTNPGSTVQTGDFVATPTENGCTGTPQNFSITVNPIPSIPAVTSQTVCANTNTSAINFDPTPATATVNWTNSDGTIGVGAAGSGNIAAFSGTNAGATPVTGNFVATPTLNGCTGTSQNFSITVNPIPSIPAVTSQTICANANTTTIVFNPTPVTATVNWTNSDGTIGVGTSGSGDIVTFTGVNAGSTVLTGNFVATPAENGCNGTPQNFSITVNPIPSIPAVTSQTVCANANTTAINFNPTPATATVNWTNSDGTIGLGTSGSGDIAAFVATNAGTVPVTGNFVASPTENGCTGTSQNFSITVNPTPAIPAVTSQTVCANATTATITFNPTPATATVNWTNSDGTIGVGTSGTGDIASFTATNSGSTTLTGNFVATPSENGCTGTAQNFSITVDPIPSIPAVTSQTICANANTTTIVFNPTPPTATVNWTNSDGTIGVGTSGVGDITSFTGINAGSTVLTGNFVATPTENGCTGVAQNFSITVNPIPSIPAVTNQTVCATANTTTIVFNPSPATATVNWTNSDGTIGVGTTGSGDITSFSAINTGPAPVTGNFVATPTENGCTGASQNFSITVNPTPSITAVASQTVCANANTSAITFNPTPATATVNWTNSDGTIGVGTSGSGDIAAFTGLNSGSTDVTGNFVATPTENGCSGAAQNFSITISPLPGITQVTNQTICANATTSEINFVSVPAGATINWTNTDASIGIGLSGTGDIASFTGLNSGTTTVSGDFSAVATLNGCTGTAMNFTITVNPLPTPTASSDAPECVNGTINFSAGGGTGYSWSGPNSFSSSSQNPTLSSVTTAMAGVYTVTVTDVNSCVATATTDVVINTLPVATIGSNSPVCMGGIINLNAGGGVTYSWSGPNGFLSSSATPAISPATAAMTGNYSVVVTDANGCSSPSFITVNVVALPSPFAGSNGPVCEGGNLLLSLSQPYASYSWTGPNSFSSSVQNPTVTSPVAASAGVYSVTVTDNNGCTGDTTVQVTVNPLPFGTFQSVPSKCAPLCDTLVFIPQINNIVTYVWDLGVGVPSVNNDSIAHCYSLSGVYPVAITLVDANSCANTIRNGALVTVYENPVADFAYSPNPITVLEPATTFYDYSSGPSATFYDWQFGSPVLGVSNSASPTFTFPDVGVYDVTLTIMSSEGCTSTVVKPVEVLEEFAIYIPNAFTPNGDGDNETFGPIGIGIDKEKYHLYIYDRWGEKLFESSEYGKDWDGKKMGNDKVSQEDVYIYKLECRKLNGEKFTKSGHVTLVR